MELVIVNPDAKVDQSWTINDIVTKAPPRTWNNVFRAARNELAHISRVLEEKEKIFGQSYPLRQDIFNAFRLTPLPKVSVVIVGQDPYPQTISVNGAPLPRAVGLSFSVRPEDSVPQSLTNIYKEIKQEIPNFVIPDHGDLRNWAKQGVLLLNSSLTLFPNQPNSHSGLWDDFIKRVIDGIFEVNPNCIFVLWGREAQAYRRLIDNRGFILEAPHPSGQSAYKGFFGSGHFQKINELLLRQKREAITWSLPTRQEILIKEYGLPESPSPPPNINLVPVDPLTMYTGITKAAIQPARSSPPKSQLPIIPNTQNKRNIAIPQFNFAPRQP